MRRRTRKPYFTQRKRGNVFVCELALLLLTLLISLGGIKGEHIRAVQAQTVLPSTLVEAFNFPSPTPTPTPKVTSATFKSPKPAPKIEPALQSIISLVKRYFPEDPATALAIFKSESGLQNYKWNYNCYFENGKAVAHKTNTSWVCPKGQESLAWSVDCGLVQNNFPGLKECPAEAFDPEWSLKTARPKYDWRKAIGLSGWEAWTVYNDNRYQNFLDWAKGVIGQ